MMYLLGAAAALGAGLVAFAATRPEDFRVERSITINAPPDKVFDMIADFRQFEKWSPWEKLDPNLQKTFEGTDKAVGSAYSWTGNKKVGQGKMTITGVVPNERIDIKLEFLKPFESTSTTSWSLQPEGDGTRMTWAMEGKNDNLMKKVFATFMNMDKMLGKDFDEGLANVKRVSEGVT